MEMQSDGKDKALEELKYKFKCKILECVCHIYVITDCETPDYAKQETYYNGSLNFLCFIHAMLSNSNKISLYGFANKMDKSFMALIYKIMNVVRNIPSKVKKEINIRDHIIIAHHLTIDNWRTINKIVQDNHTNFKIDFDPSKCYDMLNDFMSFKNIYSCDNYRRDNYRRDSYSRDDKVDECNDDKDKKNINCDQDADEYEDDDKDKKNNNIQLKNVIPQQRIYYFYFLLEIISLLPSDDQRNYLYNKFWWFIGRIDRKAYEFFKSSLPVAYLNIPLIKPLRYMISDYVGLPEKEDIINRLNNYFTFPISSMLDNKSSGLFNKCILQ